VYLEAPATIFRKSMDYSRYTSLSISRRGAHGDVLDIQMRADAPGGNGKLPTSGLRGHWELSEIWRDLGADDSVRCAVLRGDGLGFSGGGDLAMVQAIADDFVARAQVWKEARDLVYNVINCSKPIVSAMHGPAVGAGGAPCPPGRSMGRRLPRGPGCSTLQRRRASARFGLRLLNCCRSATSSAPCRATRRP